MISPLKDWINRQIALGTFLRRRDVLIFAATRTFWTTLAAMLLNIIVYRALGYIDLFHVDVPDSLLGDAVVTALVAGTISLIAYYMVGAAILDLSISRQQFVQLSRTDPLTGLLNRRAFVESIAALDRPYMLAILDIDRFKAINDTFGHDAGDQVLVDVSDMLRRSMGPDNVVARLGGEEFGAVLTHPSRQRNIAIVDHFRATMAARTFLVADTEITVTMSIGVSEADGRLSYSALLSHADKALYLAKASGRNRVVHAEDLSAVLLGDDHRSGRRIG